MGCEVLRLVSVSQCPVIFILLFLSYSEVTKSTLINMEGP